MVMGLVSSVFGGIGRALDDLMSGAGNIGSSISYLTGRTGRLLKEGAEESIRRNGRILNREQQARGVFNRTVLRGQVVQERLAMQGPAPLTSVREAVNSLAAQDRRYAVNTTTYEKALASRARARNFLGKRLAPAAALIGGGYIGGAIMRNIVDERKAYYGEEAYTARYGEGGERAASLIETAGLVVGGSALIGKDPISGTAKLAKRLSKRSRHKAIRSRIIEREAVKRIENAEVVGTSGRVATFSKVPSIQELGSAEKVRKVYNKTLRKERNLLKKELKRKNVRLSPEMENLRERVGRQDKLIKQNSRLAGLYSGPLVAAGAVGLGAAAVLAPDPMITIGTSVVLGAAMAPRAVGFALRHKAALGVAGATVATGAAIGMNVPQYAAAEGNIQEVTYARQSATQKLNYSTAGLVQAIHNNRRM